MSAESNSEDAIDWGIEDLLRKEDRSMLRAIEFNEIIDVKEEIFEEREDARIHVQEESRTNELIGTTAARRRKAAKARELERDLVFPNSNDMLNKVIPEPYKAKEFTERARSFAPHSLIATNLEAIADVRLNEFSVLAEEKEVIDYDKERIRKGGFFFHIRLVGDGRFATMDFFGERASHVFGLFNRSFWKKRGYRSHHGLSYVLPMSDWEPMMNHAANECPQISLGPILRQMATADYRYQKDEAVWFLSCATIGAKMSKRKPWTAGNCRTFSYYQQIGMIRYTSSCCYVLSQMMLKYPIFTEKASLWMKGFIDCLSSDGSPFPEAIAAEIKQQQLEEIPQGPNFFMIKQFLAELRDFMTVAATKRHFLMTEDQKRAAGLNPIIEANEIADKERKEGPEDVIKDILGHLSMSHEELLRRTQSSLLRNADFHSEVKQPFKKIEDLEMIWGEAKENRIQLQLGVLKGATTLTRKATGGNGELMCAMTKAMADAGKTANPLVIEREVTLRLLKSKSFQGRMEACEDFTRDISREIIRNAMEKDPKEKNVFVEMIITSPDGKIRYTTMAERIWGTMSYILFIRAKIKSKAALRGKGNTDLAQVLEDNLNKWAQKDTGFILTIESDLTEATFRLHRLNIKTLMEFARSSQGKNLIL